MKLRQRKQELRIWVSGIVRTCLRIASQQKKQTYNKHLQKWYIKMYISDSKVSLCLSEYNFVGNTLEYLLNVFSALYLHTYWVSQVQLDDQHQQLLCPLFMEEIGWSYICHEFLTHMFVLFVHMLTHICEIIFLCITVTFHVLLILHWLTYTYMWKYLFYFSLHRHGSPTETADFLCTFGIDVINYTKRLL